MTIETTTAIVINEVDAPPRLETISVGVLQPDEVLVDIRAVGVCHTDLSCIDGTLPTQFPCVLGHEGAGIIQEVGKNITHVSQGDKVLLSFAFCGDCEQCKGNHPAYCLNFVPYNFGFTRTDGTSALSLDGKVVHANFFGQSSFARHAVVHKSSVVRVPADTDLTLFAPMGCGLQTGSGAVLNTLNVQPGASFAVFGAGSVGLAAVMAARIRGAHPIIAVDLQTSRLEKAKELGATHGIIGSDTDVVDQIRKLCPPNGVKYAAECTGVPKVLETATDALGTKGKVAAIGAPTPGKRAAVEVFWHTILGKELVGCVEGDTVPTKFLPYLIEQHRQGKFPVEELVTKYPVRDVETAFKDMKQGKTIKAVLIWD